VLSEFIDIKKHANVAIYPACDSDCIFDDEFIGLLEKAVSARENSMISISKKTVIADDVLEKIRDLNRIFVKNGSCIVISVSFSNITRIGEIEKGCANYIDRINFLSSLESYKIPHNVIIKPILPFISFDEYTKIIDDTMDKTSTYVLGGLYVDKDNPFYKSFIEKNNYELIYRPVSWLKPVQSWFVVESERNKGKLHEYIKNKARHSFESDVDSLEHIRKKLLKM